MVTQADLDQGRLYPPLSNIREVSLKIAVQTMQQGYDDGTASLYPEPEFKEAFIRSKMYNYYYDSFLPTVYDWPAAAGYNVSDQEFAKLPEQA